MRETGIVVGYVYVYFFVVFFPIHKRPDNVNYISAHCLVFIVAFFATKLKKNTPIVLGTKKFM